MEQLHLLNKRRLFATLLILMVLGVKAQDPIFSQFYLNKTYLNPAYAGWTYDFSVGFQSRYQWTHIPGTFQTNTASVNFAAGGSKLGVGLQFYDNREGEGRLQTRSGNLQLSYNMAGRFNQALGRKMYGRKYIISFGMQGGVGQKSIDWSKFTFTDQLDPYKGLVSSQSSLTQGAEVSNMIYDLSAGIRARAEVDRRGSYISFGAAMFHLNKPKESFFGFDNQLDIRYTGHFFIHFQTKKFVNDPRFLSIGYVVDKQQVLQTNTIYVSKDIGKNFKLGMGFRRKLVFNIDHNNDSFITQFSYSKNNLQVGYSYDITVSSLGAYSTYGTHEIGLIYIFEGSRLKKKTKTKDRNDKCFFLNSKGTVLMP